MLVTKLIKVGVIKLTNSKKECLDHEYNGFQKWMIFGEDSDILSQHKRAKGWYYDKNNVLAIDLGERNIATICNSSNLKPIFYGRTIRGIRRHYNYLRKQLGEKKLLKKIKSLENKEKRIIEQELHNISNDIVEEAVKTSSMIFLGDLKDIRKSCCVA